MHPLLLSALLLTTPTRIQTPAPPIDPTPFTFEVISIHQDSPDSFSGGAFVDFTPSRYTASHISVKELLREAYRVDDLQLDHAPAWLDSESYTIDAVANPERQRTLAALPPEQRDAAERHMLQALLTSRFHLILTTETKIRAVYVLKASKNPPTLPQTTSPSTTPASSHQVGFQFIGGDIRMDATAATMDQLIDRLNEKLSQALGRTFINETGIAGEHDFLLHFRVPWPTTFGPAGPDTVTLTASAEDSLAAAMESDLGLQLQSASRAIPLLSIAHIEHPSEN